MCEIPNCGNGYVSDSFPCSWDSFPSIEVPCSHSGLNFKTPRKETESNTKGLKDHLCSQISRMNIVRNGYPTKNNWHTHQNSSVILYRNGKNNYKTHIEAKIILEKKRTIKVSKQTKRLYLFYVDLITNMYITFMTGIKIYTVLNIIKNKNTNYKKEKARHARGADHALQH